MESACIAVDEAQLIGTGGSRLALRCLRQIQVIVARATGWCDSDTHEVVQSFGTVQFISNLSCISQSDHETVTGRIVKSSVKDVAAIFYPSVLPIGPFRPLVCLRRLSPNRLHFRHKVLVGNCVALHGC